ncbi:hypothetical protein E8E13_009946 [Curvularia kusanoi]|uniref:Cytochrome P450 n=1 Tax=Curvularia kusanoi TaxID=90978 RepID=A0A9P4TDA7_CURKU|nr:hypothetical protein E8E13_009946 [Curvularia kusanoi]
MDRLWDQYGDTFVISIFGARVVFTRDAAAIRQVLSVQWVDYDTAKGIRTEMFKLLAPGSIASTDGKAWEDERRKWRRSLAHHDQLLDLPFLEKSFRLFLCRIPAGDAVDLQPLVLDMVTDIIRNFVIGESAHSLDPENQPEEIRESIAALERIGPAMVIQGLLGPLSWLIPRNNFKADCRLFKDLLKRTIRGKLASRESSQAVSDSFEAYKTSFLDRLSIHTSDPEILSNDVTAALMASESTARPISHTIWLLSQHPEIYAKLRKSIADTVGNREPTYEELNKFIYLRNVLNESLRLLPPTSVTLRRANRDTWLPSGGGEDGTEQLLLQKGDRVFISIFGTQRLPATFGKDACEFKPERWEHLSVNTPGFAVFSMGPRLCAGSKESST